jgi:serine protease Do
VVISDVAAGQPAARGGLLRGDKVIAINGNPVREYDDLFMNIAAALAGSEVEVEVVRGPAKRKLTARLAKSGHSEPRIASNRPKPVFGLSVDYTSTLSIDTNPLEGVLIRKELEPGSPAEKKFKEWLDRSELIIVKVNDKHVSTPSDFYREAAGKDSIVLDVFEAVRDNDPRHQRIKLP